METVAPGDTLGAEFGHNGGFFLSKKEAFAFFKKNKVTPLDLKIVKCWESIPGCSLTKIAERIGKTKQFVAYRTKKLVELGILTQVPGFNGAYEKGLKYLGWSIPELRAQIESKKPLIEWEPPAEFEQEQGKPKVKPRQKAPERLTVEMHDPLFRLMPKDLNAYRGKKSISVSWYEFSKNNEVRKIPDAMLDNFGRDILHRKDYFVGVKSKGLDVFLYPNDGDSQKVAIADLKARGEELKKKVEALYGLEFQWQHSIEKAMDKHPVSYVLKPGHSQVPQVKAPASMPPAPAQQVLASASSPPVQAPALSVQELAQSIALALKQSGAVGPVLHIGPDGSDKDGLEGRTHLVYSIADQYNQIGELKKQVNQMHSMDKAMVKEALKEVLQEIFQPAPQEVPRTRPAPAEAYM